MKQIWRRGLSYLLIAAMSVLLLAGCETENAPSNSGVGLSELFSTAPWFPKEQLVYEGLTEPEPEPRVKPEDFDWENDKEPEPLPNTKDPEALDGPLPTEEELKKQYYETEIYDGIYDPSFYYQPLHVKCYNFTGSWDSKPLFDASHHATIDKILAWEKAHFAPGLLEGKTNIDMLREVGISKEELIEMNKQVKERYWKEGGDKKWGWLGKYARKYYTDEQIEAIISGTEEEINKAFVSDFSIMVGNKIYTPKMLLELSVAELKAAGITRAMMEDKYVNEWTGYLGNGYLRWDLKDKMMQM